MRFFNHMGVKVILPVFDSCFCFALCIWYNRRRLGAEWKLICERNWIYRIVPGTFPSLYITLIPRSSSGLSRPTLRQWCRMKNGKKSTDELSKQTKLIIKYRWCPEQCRFDDAERWLLGFIGQWRCVQKDFFVIEISGNFSAPPNDLDVQTQALKAYMNFMREHVRILSRLWTLL